MDALITALTTGGVAIVTALVSLIVNRINARKVRSEIESIREELGDGKYYIICPKCGEKIYLIGTEIRPAEEMER